LVLIKGGFVSFAFTGKEDPKPESREKKGTAHYPGQKGISFPGKKTA